MYVSFGAETTLNTWRVRTIRFRFITDVPARLSTRRMARHILRSTLTHYSYNTRILDIRIRIEEGQERIVMVMCPCNTVGYENVCFLTGDRTPNAGDIHTAIRETRKEFILHNVIFCYVMSFHVSISCFLKKNPVFRAGQQSPWSFFKVYSTLTSIRHVIKYTYDKTVAFSIWPQQLRDYTPQRSLQWHYTDTHSLRPDHN